MGPIAFRGSTKYSGPGNQYVTGAKQLVQQEGVAIDMPAGPSEVCVLADATANPAFVASDLLSQAEHGADSQVLLVTTEEPLAGSVMAEVQRQLQDLPRKDLAERALEHSRIVVVTGMPEALELVNEYAPEHLIVVCANPGLLAESVVNAGSVFIGNYSPESAGDYASGTNHTLPTNGFARAYSGVSLDSFVRKITYQELTREGLERLAPTVVEMAMAEAEGLEGARAGGTEFDCNYKNLQVDYGHSIWAPTLTQRKTSKSWCLIPPPGTSSRVRPAYTWTPMKMPLGPPCRWRITATPTRCRQS